MQVLEVEVWALELFSWEQGRIHSYPSRVRVGRGHISGRFPDWKILNSKGLEKKIDTTPNFLHSGPKKDVESEYDIYFGQILANKIRNGFLY